MSRRPSISIYDYPEDLNPFNDDETTTATTTTKQFTSDTKNTAKEPKHKFWTFGRSKKKRSNSFSIKSTWSGLFGKRKDSEVELRKPTIATVSSTYNRGTYNGYPSTPVRLSKDQQEFNEALGTLARRRKYTLDNSSRYSSTLTVNGDPGRIYEGSPQDTTTSIMVDLTPKPPARRFGQVSPKPTERIPPLDYKTREKTINGNVDEMTPNRTPVPPKRGGPRASQRSLAPMFLNDSASSRSGDSSMRDENENVPEDYVFKRCNQDATRKSNLSINSCVSVGSTVSGYGRKKRRAPQPPCIREPVEIPKENETKSPEEPKSDLEIAEATEIARVTENIAEMTKRSRELADENSASCSSRDTGEIPEERPADLEKSEEANESTIAKTTMTEEQKGMSQVVESPEKEKSEEDLSSGDEGTMRRRCENSSEEEKEVLDVKDEEAKGEMEKDVKVELQRSIEEEKIETIKDVEYDDRSSEEEFPLQRRKSSGNLSRSDSFSVKEKIEEIERQIKLLESKPREASNEDLTFERAGARLSLRETRKKFFREMTESDRVKIEFGELPRKQNDIKLVRIEDSPIPLVAPAEPVKVIELHISEPIRQKPSLVFDREANPIPKPRRHSNFHLEARESRLNAKMEKENEKKMRKISL